MIITGEEMKDISNQFFQFFVAPGGDHTFLLEEFMREHCIVYPYWDYCFAHEAMKLAIMGNIVVLVGSCYHVIALPDVISDFQVEYLKKVQELFYNDKSFLSIMNVQKDGESIIYEGIDSSDAKKRYSALIDEKNHKLKFKNKVKNLKISDDSC